MFLIFFDIKLTQIDDINQNNDDNILDQIQLIRPQKQEESEVFEPNDEKNEPKIVQTKLEENLCKFSINNLTSPHNKKL